MMPKKKDSPELFEVFRNAVRDRETGSDAVSSAERESLVAEAHEATLRSVEPDPPSGMGERRLSLKYNTVVLGLMAVVGLVFVSFAMGVRWGEDRAAQRRPTTVPQDQSRTLAKQLEPIQDGPSPQVVAFDPGLTQQPQEQPASPTAVAPDPPPDPQPAGKYWIRLIHFDIADASAAALVSTHLRKLGEKGYRMARERVLRDRSGQKFLAVCYGPFQTRAEAAETLPKLQAVNSRAYKQANVICDE